MKTNKLPKSAWSDSQAAGSQSKQTSQPSQPHLTKNYLKKGQMNKSRLKIDKPSEAGNASNDASYHYDHYNSANDEHSNHLVTDTSAYDSYFGYKSVKKSLPEATESAMIKNSSHKASSMSSIETSDMKSKTSTSNVARHDKNNNKSDESSQDSQNPRINHGYKKAHSYQKVTKTTDINIDENLKVDTQSSKLHSVGDDMVEGQADAIATKDSLTKKNKTKTSDSKTKNHLSADTADAAVTEIPERIFMNGLIKHTGIALAIIIPLAAFSAYAATPTVTTAAKANVTANATTDKTSTKTLSIKPSAIIHKSASVPTTVDSVDLKKYAGTWYEIGRLPMYFQRNCASDVTANYVEKTDGSGIKVINQCKAQDGSDIVAEGLAKPVDATGSKLKVTFLPSWIRWLPVGRADYWVLARDADYKTALVGTPDKDYLWLLARSPNVSQETYAKYRQIAQQQGYDLKEFKLTPQTNQTVKLVP